MTGVQTCALPIYSGPLSLFTAKVRVALAEKGLDYQHDPVNPFAPPAGYRDVSPLGKIPAFKDGDRSLCDSSVICAYLDFATVSRRFWLYDTFAGIPEAYDSEKHNSPGMAPPGLYESVVERFRPYPNVQVVRGVIPDVFASAAPERIAFLHIDLNSSKSEIAALDGLFDRVSPGGVIVFDDYGWAAYAAQQLAEEAWAAARGYRILELPTGQGLLIKGP